MLAILKACYEFEENYRPAITFIVAVKRHHGRFAVINHSNRVGGFCYLCTAKIIRLLIQALMCFSSIIITPENHVEERKGTK